jgi:hypothetical protein
MVNSYDGRKSNADIFYSLSRSERGILYSRYGHRLFNKSFSIKKQVILLRAKDSSQDNNQSNRPASDNVTDSSQSQNIRGQNQPDSQGVKPPKVRNNSKRTKKIKTNRANKGAGRIVTNTGAS